MDHVFPRLVHIASLNNQNTTIFRPKYFTYVTYHGDNKCYLNFYCLQLTKQLNGTLGEKLLVRIKRQQDRSAIKNIQEYILKLQLHHQNIFSCNN